VNIVDLGTGVPTSGGNIPKIWYKLNVGGTWVSNNGVLISGDANNGLWNFDIDYSKLGFGTPVNGDQIYYYVVTQDQATTPNIWCNPFVGASHGDVNTQTTPPTTPNSYYIATGISGTYTIGIGETYTSFTRDEAGGFFKFLNNIDGITSVIDGPITAIVVSDISNENGAVALGSLKSDELGPHLITISPDGTIVRELYCPSGTYAGDANKGLFTFSGASNLVIDGSYNGEGKYLSLDNRHAGSGRNCVYFENDAHDITIKNCYIKAVSFADYSKFYADVYFGNGLTTGNYNITIDNNDIGNGSYVNSRVYSNNTIANTFNRDINITNNNIFNFADGYNWTVDYGVAVTTTGNGSNWNISGNSFYITGVCSGSAQTAIYFVPGTSSTGNIIDGNFIGGGSPECGPGTVNTYWCNNNAYEGYGIHANCGDVDITNNTIKNIRYTGGDKSGFTCVYIPSGNTVANISGNTFGDLNDGEKRIQALGGGVSFEYNYGNVFGIKHWGSGDVIIDNNIFSYLVANGGCSYCMGSYVRVIEKTNSGTATITNNVISMCQGAGYNADSYAIRLAPSSNTSGHVIANNTIMTPLILGAGSSISSFGIFIDPSSYDISGTISKNKIYDNRNSSPSGYTEGIWLKGWGTQNWVVDNNMVSLNNSLGTSSVALYGIEDGLYQASGSTVDYLYNSVYISGNHSGSGNTYAFLRQAGGNGNSAGDIVNLKNNIFINTRSSGSGSHYAIGNHGSACATNWNADASNYNLLLSNNSSTLGYWGSSSKDFSGWCTTSNGDGNSLSATYSSGNSSFVGSPYPGSNMLNPAKLFEDPSVANLHILKTDGQSHLFVGEKGIDLTAQGITTDIDDNVRPAQPAIGAHEVNASMPICETPTVGGTVSGSSTVCSGSNSTLLILSGHIGSVLNWEYSTNGNDWYEIANTSNTYTAENLTVATQYRAVLQNGAACEVKNSISAIISVDVASVGGSVSGSTTVCSETNSSELTLLGHTGIVIKWQYSTDDWSTAIDIANTSTTHTVSNLTTTTKFRAVVQSGVCAAATSSDATISVDPASVGGTVSSNQSILYNTQPADLTLTGYTGDIVEWQKDVASAFTNPVTISITNSTLNGAIIGNLTETTYFRAIVQSGVCSSTSSSFVEVLVGAASNLTCVDMILPANNGIGLPLTSTLEWTGVEDATKYVVYLDTQTPPTQEVTSILHEDGTMSINTSLYTKEYNKKYYWTIVPLNDNDTLKGCPVWSFTTEDVHCTELLAPENGATNVSPSQLLVWEPLQGEGVSYRVYFGEAGSMTYKETTGIGINTYKPSLEFGKQYQWQIIPKTETSEAAGCVTYSFTVMNQPSDATLTWKTTATDNDWNKADNWWLEVGVTTSTYAPTYANDVVIPAGATNYPIINNIKLAPAECKDMLIAKDASVTIDANKGLTVKGNMTNNGLLHIKSIKDPNGSIHKTQDGSLIVDGNESGTGTYKIDRYVSGNFWHMVSSPVQSAKVSVFNNMWIRDYDESKNVWGSFIVSPAQALVVGKGYSVWTYEEAETRTFQGKINNADISLPVTHHKDSGLPPSMWGYNLVGNPYPSAIKWSPNDNTMWERVNVTNNIQMFSGEAGNYIVYNPNYGMSSENSEIALGQSFFIQTSNSNPSLIIKKGARLHSTVTFRDEPVIDDNIVIKVSGNNYSDECYVLYRADAADGYDYDYDAVKFDGVAEAPQLHTVKIIDGFSQRLTAQAVNSLDKLQGMIVYLQVGADSEYTLEFAETMVQSFKPVVRDRFADLIILPNTEYSFTALSDDNLDRFEILDQATVSTPEFSAEDLVVWSHNNILYVDNLQTSALKQVVVYDILGSEVFTSVSAKTNLSGLSRGVYLVRVITDKQTVVKKVSVQ